jgi:hypothetical protein
VASAPSPPASSVGRSVQLHRTAASLAQADGRLGWAPIAAALAIDLADFATAGPIGLVLGLFVGGLLTTTVAFASGAKPRRALGLGLFGAVYCALPMTEAIPLATMLTLVHGFLLRTPQRDTSPHAPALER